MEGEGRVNIVKEHMTSGQIGLRYLVGRMSLWGLLPLGSFGDRTRPRVQRTLPGVPPTTGHRPTSKVSGRPPPLGS